MAAHFTALAPRQPLTPAPYALYAPSAGSASNLAGIVPATELTGTVPLAQLPAAVVTNNASGVNLSGVFTGNGGALTNLDSRQLTGPLALGMDPVRVGGYATASSAYGVAVAGNYAYVADDSRVCR